MRLTYFKIIVDYGPLIAATISSLLFLIAFLKPLSSNILSTLSFTVLIITSIVSLEFYPFQIITLPINLIIPISICIIYLLKSKKLKIKHLLPTILIIISLYLILGLVALSESSNTWGSGGAIYGIFIVPNCLIILASLFFIQKKHHRLFIICKLFIAIVGFIVLYYATNEFSYGEYDGEDVRLRRYSSILICILSLIDSFLIYLQKKRFVTL